ncbi:MAG: response regulator [Thermodesulfovibrionales bacterium]|nr:response regulator [Thermodesulfovibrionales bacterium]
MSIITVFSGNYCNEETAIKEILKQISYRHLTDADIVAKAAGLSNLSESKITRAFSTKTSVFNQLTHEKERSIAYLKLATAEIFAEYKDKILLAGFTSILVPAAIRHALRICLIADMKHRVSVASSSGMSESEAIKLIHKGDAERMLWTQSVLEKDDPWDASIYDMVLPSDKMSSTEIAGLVGKTLDKDILKASPASEQSIEDFLLAARVGAALAKEGHFIAAEADAGAVTLTINKHVLMLQRLEEELRAVAVKVPGVKSVSTKVGKKFYQADVYRKYDLETPSKLLLVDDERKFVQTLSDRLRLREIGSVVAYDGESALDLIKEEEPDVMILDLKMPGIDGLEVLKRVKQTSPNIEVIILTGHGSEADKKLCMDLGAFAYLEKPVDVNLLSETINKANEKIRQNRENA